MSVVEHDVVTAPPAPELTCELTADGYLRLGVDVAATYFPADVCVASRRGQELLLMPLLGAGNGGLVFSQRNLRGDRSLLVSEALGFDVAPGVLGMVWDAAHGALRVSLDRAAGPADHRTDGPVTGPMTVSEGPNS